MIGFGFPFHLSCDQYRQHLAVSSKPLELTTIYSSTSRPSTYQFLLCPPKVLVQRNLDQ